MKRFFDIISIGVVVLFALSLLGYLVYIALNHWVFASMVVGFFLLSMLLFWSIARVKSMVEGRPDSYD